MDKVSVAKFWLCLPQWLLGNEGIDEVTGHTVISKNCKIFRRSLLSFILDLEETVDFQLKLTEWLLILQIILIHQHLYSSVCFHWSIALSDFFARTKKSVERTPRTPRTRVKKSPEETATTDKHAKVTFLLLVLVLKYLLSVRLLAWSDILSDIILYDLKWKELDLLKSSQWIDIVDNWMLIKKLDIKSFTEWRIVSKEWVRSGHIAKGCYAVARVWFKLITGILLFHGKKHDAIPLNPTSKYGLFKQLNKYSKYGTKG